MTNPNRTKPFIEPNTVARVVSSSRPYVNWASWVVGIISIMVMIGWVFNIDAIKNVIPYTVTMKFNTALGFLCGSISLLLLQRKNMQQRNYKIGRALAVITMLIGLLTLTEYIFGWNLYIDQLFVHDGNTLGNPYPGRMAFVASICFSLWGLSLLYIRSVVSQFLSIGILFLSMLGVIGYLFDYHTLYRLTGYETIAFLTVLLFLILSLATLFANPQQGIMKIAISIAASGEAGGRLIRLYVPLSIFVVALLGWLASQGGHFRVFDAGNTIVVFVVLVIFFYTPILFHHADKVNKSEHELVNYRFHDPLTGLFNQSYFQEEIARLERGREFPVSILIADVDNLEEVNDQYGHAIGDLLLIQTAQILTAAFRAHDVIARIGGDKFAVLLPATDQGTAESLLHRIRQYIVDSNKTNPIVAISLSLGVGTASHPALIVSELKKAGENLYQDKLKQKNAVG